MATALALIGAFGIIGSLLFAGFQARALARQVGNQATRDGVATLQETLNSLRNVQHYLVEDPSLIPHFAPERSDRPLDEADAGKVQMVAAMYADVLNIGLHNLSAVPAAKPESAWLRYCHHVLESSPAVRAEVTRKPWGYPRLSMLEEFHASKGDAGRARQDEKPTI
ncbi:hypothetical protein [Paractinoplanes maris]|uniref:hypothetical protein n=1 Tax=Paractinoplanes maris TaxID=1734446 RepID=UPI0020204E1A|nr:hypothetical protein [Actinoplanes maris]